MPVRIRLARVGRKKVARYRIVAADGRVRRDGRFLETLGSYSPQSDPKEFTIKADRVAHWLQKGAVPTVTVKNLLKQDRMAEKLEGIGKGLTAEQMNIERKPERTRKPKAKGKKKAG
ncbi:MAG: 30S ribosomal protein S16 [Chitinivibrionales bacterium]|nr:30S ribosomal protein S16 [Chitinivibrionales bacterium]MBD3394141.1 30S ribosomal protein S16 [Chitinivibrionales bacterium]